MNSLKKLLFIISLLLPATSYAGIPLLLTDVSAGVFRFQMSLADQGNPEAQYQVGEMYEKGKGVPKDLQKAQSWFEKAAAQGHKKAAYKILYNEIQTNGLNDYSKTQLGVLRQESASGNADAQYYLGKMYAAGVGVPKSLNNALTWLNKATFNGIPEAEHEAIAVEEELARIRANEAKKRAMALEASKQKKAEEQKLKAQKLKEAEDKRKAEEARLVRQKELELKRTAEERRRLEAERAALAREKAQLEQQRSQRAAATSTAASTEEVDEPPKNEKFETDPCKGPQARFLSTCR